MSKRPSVCIVGLGPWEWEHLTLLAAQRLSEDVPIFSPFGADYHPVLQRLADEGKATFLFHLYEQEEIPHHQKYAIFADVVIRAAREFGRAILAMPGNVFVYDMPSAIIAQRCKQEEVELEIVPGISSIEAMYCELAIDPGDGLQLLDGYQFHAGTTICTDLPALVLQLIWPNAAAICATLARHYPPEHEVTVVEAAGYRGQGKHTRSTVGTLEQTFAALKASGTNDSLTTMYIPALGAADAPPPKAEATYRRTAHQVVEHALLEGGTLLVPVREFATARDLEDVQVILELPEYLRLWELLKEGGTVAELRAQLGELVDSEEQVRHLLVRFFDHGLIDDPPA